MYNKENQIARAKVRAILRELRKRKCDNFTVLGPFVSKATKRVIGQP
jgi:hypothetical protein